MAKNLDKSQKKKADLRGAVIDFFNTENQAAYNYKQVSAGVGASTPKSRADVVEILEQLALDGFLSEVSPGKFKAKQRGTTGEGVFVRRSNGKNSVIIDDADEAIFVAERNSMHALNGDRVLVHICANRRGFEPEAEVLQIIEHKDQVFIGTLQVEKYFAHLVTDSKFLATDIFIPKNKLKGGHTGDKAIARIIEWPDDANSPVGEIVDILGETGNNDVEQNAILAEFGLPYVYPEDVVLAADKIDAGITPDVIAERRDMRGITTFTIDPKDAKDFDDALSIRTLDNGNFEVGVHIADVTHYVTPGSTIDQEAESRATSVYLVDRVVPMLPEHLCNGICSLRPDEEKLTFSCVFEMDANAKVINKEICRTVIKSNRRFTYEEAQERIETGKGDFCEEILTLDRLAKILRARRYEEGSIDFDRCEVRFDIDETGRPIDVYFKESKDANKLIEEFMLLANKTVAEAIGKMKRGRSTKAFVYRVHDVPNEEKLANLVEIAHTFGHKFRLSSKRIEMNKSLNTLLQDIKGKGEENLISTLAMRSMAKAVYTTDNIGHYGLGFDFYTHFTSPIRRYPDMMVHRLLDKYLNGGRSVNKQKLEDECKHCSEMEQLAANAERASIKYKQVEYLGERLGEVYEGVISGVTEWGLYVELNENKCEGLVPIRDLEDDFYELDEKNYCLIGRRKKMRYRLGDPITIQVARADLAKKQLDFALVDKDHPANPDLKNGKMKPAFSMPKKMKDKREKHESANSKPSKRGKRRRARK